MLHFHHRFLCCGLALAISACGTLKPKSEPDGEAALTGEGEAAPDEPLTQPLLIGQVEVVHGTGGFVLVRPNGSVSRGLERGTLLEARSADGAIVPLQVSPERNRSFLVADYDGVAPVEGSLVMLVPQKPEVPDESGEAPTAGIDDVTSDPP